MKKLALLLTLVVCLGCEPSRSVYNGTAETMVIVSKENQGEGFYYYKVQDDGEREFHLYSKQDFKVDDLITFVIVEPEVKETEETVEE